MKKLTCVLLAMMMCCGFTACGLPSLIPSSPTPTPSDIIPASDAITNEEPSDIGVNQSMKAAEKQEIENSHNEMALMDGEIELTSVEEALVEAMDSTESFKALIDSLSSRYADTAKIPVNGEIVTLGDLRELYEMIVRNEKIVEENVSANGDYSWWNNDWYGWWAITDGSGAYKEYKNIAWDTCAQITTFHDNTAIIRLWDVLTDSYNDLMLCFFKIIPGDDERGIMVSDAGTFFDAYKWAEGTPHLPAGIGERKLIIDPCNSTVSSFKDMIEILGSYQDPENEENYFKYAIYLRPWGMTWDDVQNGDTTGCIFADMMPLGYNGWYLPLIQMGITEAPDSVEAGAALL